MARIGALITRVPRAIDAERGVARAAQQAPDWPEHCRITVARERSGPQKFFVLSPRPFPPDFLAGAGRAVRIKPSWRSRRD
jgi:hypothetical protein